jgi:hypothetical protein
MMSGDLDVGCSHDFVLEDFDFSSKDACADEPSLLDQLTFKSLNDIMADHSSDVTQSRIIENLKSEEKPNTQPSLPGPSADPMEAALDLITPSFTARNAKAPQFDSQLRVLTVNTNVFSREERASYFRKLNKEYVMPASER